MQLKNDKRIKRVHWALVDSKGTFWQSITGPSPITLYQAFGSKADANRAGWKATKVTLYFNMPDE